MSKQRNDVNTRGEAEFQPNKKLSPPNKEQAWLKTTTGQMHEE